MSWGAAPSIAHRVRSTVDLASGCVQIRPVAAVLLTGSRLSPLHVFSPPETVLLLRASAAPRALCYAAGTLPAAHFHVPSCWETGCGFAVLAQSPALESGEGSCLPVSDHQK